MKEGDVEVKKCTECHLDKKQEVPSIKTAMHKNCKDCHKVMKKKVKKQALQNVVLVIKNNNTAG